MAAVKDVEFVGSSADDPRAFPPAARQRAGFQLYLVQAGQDPSDWKPMTAVGPGCCEIRVPDSRGAYRVLYVATISRRRMSGKALRKQASGPPRRTLTGAENMKIRSALMHELVAHISETGMTQREAAQKLGVTQPRISDLVRGRIDLFSIDALVNMLTAAGLHIDLRIRETS